MCWSMCITGNTLLRCPERIGRFDFNDEMFLEEGAPRVPKFTGSQPEWKTGIMYDLWKTYVEEAFGMWEDSAVCPTAE